MNRGILSAAVIVLAAAGIAFAAVITVPAPPAIPNLSEIMNTTNNTNNTGNITVSASVTTDKKLYDVGESVSVEATASGTGGFGLAFAEILMPDGKKSSVQMTESGCSSGNQVTCSYETSFDAAGEGRYLVTIRFGTLLERKSTSFDVIENDTAANYLILHDIGNYTLESARKFADSPGGYMATYRNNSSRILALIAVFDDPASVENFLGERLKGLSVSTSTVNDNTVYTVNIEGNGVVFWKSQNLLVILAPVKSTGFIPGPAVPGEILSAYLNKHPSDSGQILPATTQVLVLKPGWNLVSSPLTGTQAFASHQTTCTYTSPLWAFDSGTQQYEQATQLAGKKGMWIRVAGDCTTTVVGDSLYTLNNFFPLALGAGWNFIAGPPTTVQVSELTGCTITRGPFWYNPSTGWEQSTALEPGKGYALQVGGNCNLDLSPVRPPAPPIGSTPLVLPP